MDDEQKKWQRQYIANIGTKEILRLGLAIFIWLLVGALISVALGLAGYSTGEFVIGVFICSALAFTFVSSSWRPAYIILRIIMGNRNLPTEPVPHSKLKGPYQSHPWWSYLPGVWWLVIGLLLLYLVIRYFSK